jgi:Protein of unknown function (DUF3501)
MIDPSDLMTLQAYSLHRREHRRRMIAHRRLRTVPLGPHFRLQFEDELTLRHQIQEVLWADRSEGDDAVRHEIGSYGHLLPDGASWKATLLIELPNADERERRLPTLHDAAFGVYVELRDARHGRLRVMAAANEDLSCGHRTRPSGVHFLRFALDAAFLAALGEQRQAAELHLGCTHPHYHWRRVVPPATLASLGHDLEGLDQTLDRIHRAPQNGLADTAPAHAE